MPGAAGTARGGAPAPEGQRCSGCYCHPEGFAEQSYESFPAALQMIL